MKDKIINAVIIFSLIGIAIILTKDYYTQKKMSVLASKEKIIKQIITTIPTIKPITDPLVECNNKFFNFKKGTTWKYQVKSEYNILTQKETYEDVLTNKIIEASGSSVLIETTSQKDNTKETTKIICKKSGIYNIPFPTLNKLNTIFIPNENKIIANGVWENNFNYEIPLNFSLPIDIPKIDLGLKHKVNSLIGKKAEVLVDTQISSMIPLEFTDKTIKYTLEENKGFTAFSANFIIKEIGSINLSLRLLSFLP